MAQGGRDLGQRLSSEHRIPLTRSNTVQNRKYGDLEVQLARLRRELTRRDATEAKLSTENEQLRVELRATRSALTASVCISFDRLPRTVLTLCASSRRSSP